MGKGGNILLIDDEVDLQQLVKIALETKGYYVETANNGLEGLQKLETFKPNLIILDMNMPKMGGLEFYQKICVNDRPKYPVLVLTARANMEQLFKEFNIDGFMAKPFEIDELLEEVELISRHKASSGETTRVFAGKEPFKICIVENEPEVLSKIGAAFLNAGYAVNPATSGTEAVQRIAVTLPDIALIKFGLADISGEMVVLKLKQMAKTAGVRCVLYTNKMGDIEEIADRIRQKAALEDFVPYRSPQELVETANRILHI